MAVLLPLVINDWRPKSSLKTDEKNYTWLHITYKGNKQTALEGLVKEIEAKALKLGVEVRITEHQDDCIT